MAFLPLNKGQKRDKTRRMVAFWERGGIPIRDRNQGDSVFLPMEQSVPPYGTNRKVPPSSRSARLCPIFSFLPS